MRTRHPDPPIRTKLLDAAQELMLTRGYVAASVDAICAAAGVTKGSFFHYFPSKGELGKALLVRFAEEQAGRLREACEGVEDPLERVYRMIDRAIERSQRPDMKGCLIGTVAQEIWETHPDLRQVCQDSFEGFCQGVARDLVAAKARHAPQTEFDGESLSAYFLSVVQGSMLLAKTTGDRGLMAANLSHLKHYLQTLYGR